MRIPLPLLLATFALSARLTAAEGDAKPQPRQAAGKERRAHYEAAYERKHFKGSGDSELNYGWLAPLHPKSGERYPLVIALHGSGGSVKASTVLAGDTMREKHPSFVMVPEAERSFTWAYTPVHQRRNQNGKPQEKLPVVIEALQSLLKTEAIDPARIYITGQSMGGIGSWGAIARHADVFAAAVPVCGAWAVEDVPKMTPVPVWAFHGEKDNTVPVHFSRELTTALTKAGGKAKYTEYPGVGHDSWLKAYEEADMWEWLYAQKKSGAGR